MRPPVSVEDSRLGIGIRYVGDRVIGGVSEVGRVTYLYRDVLKSMGRLHRSGWCSIRWTASASAPWGSWS